MQTIADALAHLLDVRDQVQKRIFGLNDSIDIILACMISDNHVLLEGDPGTGKTELVKAFADAFGYGAPVYSRIQFTPDLLPSDITGTLMPDPNNTTQLEFRPGPVFCNLLLADEINRAPPKTQAAMLQAMAEGHVTVLRDTHAVFYRRQNPQEHTTREPFTVIATQNPLEHAGTYDLPEALLDRFAVKLPIPHVDINHLTNILHREGTKTRFIAQKNDLDWHKINASFKAVSLLRQELLGVPMHPQAVAHVSYLLRISQGQAADCQGLEAKRQQEAAQHYDQRFERHPLGPRAGIALLSVARALWLVHMALEDFDTAIKAIENRDSLDLGPMLNTVAVPVLNHRLRERLTYVEGAGVSHSYQEAIQTLLYLAAPKDVGYRSLFESS